MINRILVAKDVTDESARVIRYALELAAKFHAQIHVLNVMPPVDSSVLDSVSLVMGADRLAKLNKENKVEQAEMIRKRLHEIIQTETDLVVGDLRHPPLVEVCHGEPVPVILDVADRLDADLIILGSYTKGTLHYAFLGSVAEKILRKANRTVTVVPPYFSEEL
jgi:nucleotide-binding universal stress UspA family protein